jgi:hypothetical protein
MNNPAVSGASNTCQVVNPGIESYFGQDASDRPEHFKPSLARYSSINLLEYMTKRGLYDDFINGLIKHLPTGACLAGGYVASVLCPEKKASDIDIFFIGPDAFVQTFDLLNNPPSDESGWVWRGYTTTTTIDELVKNRLRVVNFVNEDPMRPPIQLIKMVWFDNAEHIIDSFDFTVTQFCVSDGMLIYGAASFADLHANRLIIHRHQAPIDMLIRLVKYAKKGYNVTVNTLVEIARHVQKGGEIGSIVLSSMY